MKFFPKTLIAVIAWGLAALAAILLPMDSGIARMIVVTIVFAISWHGLCHLYARGREPDDASEKGS
jgi:hypothetical protein